MANLPSSIKTSRPKKRDCAAGLCIEDSEISAIKNAIAEYEPGMNVSKLAAMHGVVRRTLAQYALGGTTISSGV